MRGTREGRQGPRPAASGRVTEGGGPQDGLSQLWAPASSQTGLQGAARSGPQTTHPSRAVPVCPFSVLALLPQKVSCMESVLPLFNPRRPLAKMLQELGDQEDYRTQRNESQMVECQELDVASHPHPWI